MGRAPRITARMFVALATITIGYMIVVAIAQPPADPWMYVWLGLLVATAVSFVLNAVVLAFVLLRPKS